MIVNEINSANELQPASLNGLNSQETQKDEKFSDSLKELISDVNSLQKDAAELTEDFIKGEPVDIHDVMIAGQKAKTSFELLMQLRNQFTDMYREVNRMQV